MVTFTYYVQLTVIRLSLPVLPEPLAPFRFAPGSVLFAVDMLGYGFMTLATWVAAPVFTGDGLARWLRRWFVLHGVLVLPTLLAPAFMGWGDTGAGGPGPTLGALVLIGWCVIFLPLSIMVALHFRRRLQAAG